jgi:biopolymer transport protein ExbB/biopolymer transport protein TolQ
MLIQKLVYVAQVGASAVLYVLLALSVISVGVIIDRWWFFKKRRFEGKSIQEPYEKALRAGEFEAARGALHKSSSLEANVAAEAIEWRSGGAAAVQEILQKGVREKRKLFEGGLLFLGTLGNNAPFIGLFGTVLGVVTAFKELGGAQAAAAAGGGMGNVMGGISEALVATAVGILVALPAVVAYNVFQKKGTEIEENAAIMGNALLAALASHPGAAKGERAAHGHAGIRLEAEA